MRRGEQGVFTIELVLWTPVLVFLMTLAVAAGRIVQAQTQANGAARDAARAASLQRTLPQARLAAQAAATQSLQSAGITCRDMSVAITGDVAPGGAITVQVRCTAPLSDLAIPGAPGEKTLTSTATIGIETTRSR